MSFSTINNYYERLVFRKIIASVPSPLDENFLEDVACVALNHLPAKYVRHEVDMAFYMTLEERTKIDTDISNAVQNAIEYVSQHRNHHENEA